MNACAATPRGCSRIPGIQACGNPVGMVRIIRGGRGSMRGIVFLRRNSLYAATTGRSSWMRLSLKRAKRGDGMVLVLEINFVLWVMIGCLAREAFQLAM